MAFAYFNLVYVLTSDSELLTRLNTKVSKVVTTAYEGWCRCSWLFSHNDNRASAAHYDTLNTTLFNFLSASILVKSELKYLVILTPA